MQMKKFVWPDRDRFRLSNSLFLPVSRFDLPDRKPPLQFFLCHPSAFRRRQDYRRFSTVQSSTFADLISTPNLCNQRITNQNREGKEKSEFEVEKVLSYVPLGIGLRRQSKGPKKWCHVCFIAKPKKNSYSTKHFFAELWQDNDSNKWIAENCFPFQPSSDEGFEHRCVICESKTRIHPDPNE